MVKATDRDDDDVWRVAVDNNDVVALAKDWTVVVDVQQIDGHCGLALDTSTVLSICRCQLRCADLEEQRDRDQNVY